MSTIQHTKGVPYYLALPMIDSTSPASYKDGLTVTDTAYYKDGAGSWTALAITDTFTEIGSTGVYEIDLTAAEMNHDKVLIKLTASGAADDAVLFDMGVGDASSLKQDQILARLAGTVTLTAPVTPSGTLNPLIIGDDYRATNGRSLDWTIDAVANATAAGSTCKLGFDGGTKGTLVVNGTVTDNGNDTWTLSFDIEDTDSASLLEGLYDWSVELTEDASNEITKARNSNELGKVRWVNKQT